MSTLKVDSIGKTSGKTQDTMAGLVKAWCNLNGTHAKSPFTLLATYPASVKSVLYTPLDEALVLNGPCT